MKNGRFSGKYVSKAVRFKSPGSASTCPKSGLSVRSSVKLLVIPYLISAPNLDDKSYFSGCTSLTNFFEIVENPFVYGVT